MSVELSIIIPVYNAQADIASCLESILIQSYSNWEVICINDGSRDNSEQIITEYTHKDSRIRILTQANAGVSAARNKGLAEARGKYLTFVDADDKLCPNALSRAMGLLSKTPHLSLLIMDSRDVWSDGKSSTRSALRSGKKIQEAIANPLFLAEYIAKEAWGKIYRSDIIKLNHLHFFRAMKLGEDYVFVLDYLRHCPAAAYYLDIEFNLYKHSADSATKQAGRGLWPDKEYLKLPIQYKRKACEWMDASTDESAKKEINRIFLRLITQYLWCVSVDLSTAPAKQKRINRAILSLASQLAFRAGFIRSLRALYADKGRIRRILFNWYRTFFA